MINIRWKILFLIFFMSASSVLASLLMDQKLYQKSKNNLEIEVLKARFANTRTDLIKLKRGLMIKAGEFNFQRNPNIIIVKDE